MKDWIPEQGSRMTEGGGNSVLGGDAVKSGPFVCDTSTRGDPIKSGAFVGTLPAVILASRRESSLVVSD